MAIREIRKEGDEILSKKCREVEEVTDKILELGQDMLDTMYKYDGIGLAAVQVGVLQNIIVIDIDHENQKFKSEIINPKIISFSSEQSIMKEGCLSVVDRQCNVLRPNKIVVEYFTLDKNKHTVEADGLLAKCFQHEIDHTNGITIVDKEIK